MSNRTDHDVARVAVRQIRKDAAEKAGAAAWADYRAQQDALVDRTARLKELRLAAEAARAPAPKKVAKPKATVRKAGARSR